MAPPLPRQITLVTRAVQDLPDLVEMASVSPTLTDSVEAQAPQAPVLSFLGLAGMLVVVLMSYSVAGFGFSLADVESIANTLGAV